MTYSIANGLALGIISHVAIQLLCGKASRRDWLLLVLAALFTPRFAYVAAG